MKSRFNYWWISIFFGTLLILWGIILGIVGAEVLNISFVRMDLVPIAVGFCGVLLSFLGWAEIREEKNKTQEQQIEENDERNIKINENAKAKAFDLMSTLFGLGLLTLAMFGYLNRVSFFTLVGLLLISHIFRSYQVKANTQKM